jgi:integrase
VEEEKFLSSLRKHKDAERAHLLYRLMLVVTGSRVSEAMGLNVGHATQTKIKVKVKGWAIDGGKKDRLKTVYFPKALREDIDRYLRVKRRRGESG